MTHTSSSKKLDEVRHGSYSATVSDSFSEKLTMALSKNIQILRTAKGWSQQELADRVHVARATINRIENGHHKPTWDLICRLADALGASTDALRKNLSDLAKVS